MASLHHPNLVTVLDMLTEDDDLYLVMEYVPGGTLADVLEEAPLEPAAVLDLLRPVAAALDHAHENRVVHRDVKPSNVLVGDHGAVKLADLGLATAAEITRITPPGSILGTPAYMAPEQAQPVPCTPATDIFALATIAFQALSGTLPRTGSTALAVLRQAASMPPPDLRERRPGTPAAAAEALEPRHGARARASGRPRLRRCSTSSRRAWALRASAPRPTERTSVPRRCAAARPRTCSPPRTASPSPRRGAADRGGCSPCSRSLAAAAAVAAVLVLARDPAAGRAGREHAAEPTAGGHGRGDRRARGGAGARRGPARARPGGHRPRVLRARRRGRLRGRLAPRRPAHAGRLRRQPRELRAAARLARADRVPRAGARGAVGLDGDRAGPHRGHAHGPHGPLHRHPADHPLRRPLARRARTASPAREPAAPRRGRSG